MGIMSASTLPGEVTGAGSQSRTPTRGIHVPAGRDRHRENDLMIWGLIPLAIKLSTEDTGGRAFIFEHRDMGRGGPPRHIHHEQDEWFYVIKGEYVIEIGDERFTLKPGDSIFAPRKIAHAWAHISDEPGTLITEVSPVGTFEAFIRDTARQATLPSPEEIAQAFASHEMTVVGPPLSVE